MTYRRVIEGIKTIRSVDEMMPQGVTSPIGCSLLDGTEVVVKYPNNAFGNKVLVNEIIGACIGDLVGVPMPEYGICLLDEEVVRVSECYGSYGEGIDENNAGVCFFSKRYSNTTIVQDYVAFDIGRKGALIVLYDYILNNCDRHQGNLLQIIGLDELLCIDNSHIIIDKTDSISNIKDYFSEDKIMSIDYFTSDTQLYKPFIEHISVDELKDLASHIMKTITKDRLCEIRKMIPQEWILSVGDDNIRSILDIIFARIGVLDRICEKIKEATDE